MTKSGNGENERSQVTLDPDADPDLTYAAVGRATSAWEQLEARLADLYSIFVGKPQQTEALIEYGREGRNFEARMKTLSRVAPLYLQDQRHEAQFDHLLSEVKDLSILRNQVAHGTVVAVPIGGGTPGTPFPATGAFGWFLAPPWYALYPLMKRTDALYLYNAAVINGFAELFSACAAKVRDFRNRLDANWQEPPEPFGLCVWLGTPRRPPRGR
jgi:hypothetical protein